ncbi:MAG: hypothetical protein HDS09_06900 [Bacteroides sp.]|nr:hypothetical protein [Bacteroides sp.]MBD5318965.1 hypothetical protein [Bacteroides sp.]
MKAIYALHFLPDMLLRAFPWLLLAFLAVGCDRSSDTTRPVPEPDTNGGKEDNRPGNNTGDDRPGVGDKTPDFSAELADGCVRYVGRGVELRFDRCGVLVKNLADGTREFVDLDGTSRVSFVAGNVGADSICRNATLTVNGTPMKLTEVRMKKQTAEAVWYHILDVDGRDHICVISASYAP